MHRPLYYMARPCRKQSWLQERGYECKVERQGALGIENKLKAREIKEADLIVFANDVGISKAERFKGSEDKIFQTKPHDVIKNPAIIFNK